MAVDTVASFLALLREIEIVDAKRLDELEPALQKSNGDPRGLAKYLVKEGWMTTFQVNQVMQGNGRTLVMGAYRVLDRLGEGGVSQVYKAWDVNRKCLAALKVIRPDLLNNQEAVARFQREIRAIMRLSHPNIVKAFDFNLAGTTLFLAMEYVEGTELGKLVQLSGPLPPDKACDYLRQAALGLQHGHERGLIHRDIKPQNLLVTTQDNLVKILDLGLARLRQAHGGPADPKSLTAEGIMIGTIDYMSPEQAKNPRTVDIRADIYSLGCTLYYLLTGQPPFPGGALLQKLMRHRQDPVPSLAATRSDAPYDLDVAVQRMLAKEPDKRYQTPAEVAAVLKPFCKS